MGKYFGTDGVRGKANTELTGDIAFKIGLALGERYIGKRISVGMDTRLSSSMLKNAISAGVCAAGANIYDCGVVPTPCIAYITSHEDFVAGVMISASHNPYYDNGIKIFNHDGVKIDENTESFIEEVIDGRQVHLVSDEKIGTVHVYSDALIRYKQYLKDIVNLDLKGVKIAIDSANGSASVTAASILSDLGAELFALNQEPNGININTNCGSTHPEELQSFTTRHNCAVGFAFDGDADRLIAVDENGELFDGDKTLYVCGIHMNEKGELKEHTLVTTVMANLGLHKALNHKNIKTEQTQVGDKYVYDRMISNDFSIGGEQSGHIIFKEHMTTGDGVLTALKLLEVMQDKQQSLAQLSKDLVIYPQVLKNVRVNDKKKALENSELKALINEKEASLKGDGRILVRPSGTEPLVRVMVEAASDDICHQLVDEVVEKIQGLGL